jgi:hypothetical protein
MRWLLLGNPENRRVTMFQEALARQGEPPAQVLAYVDVARDPRVLESVPDEELVFRLESPGESFDLDRELLRLGHDDAVALGAQTISPARIPRLREDLGRILAPRQVHAGYLRLLDQVTRVLEKRPRWRVLQHPTAVAELFDKRVTSRRYQSLGLPVPTPLDGVTDVASLRARMADEGMPVVYVKLSCGSSASCLARFDGRVALTTMEIDRDRLYNNRNLRRHEDRASVERVLGYLLREGAQIEEDVPKASMGGKQLDCRVLTVGGEPAFTVVRRSEHPITNLHLGGERGDLAAVTRAAGPVFDEAMETCRRVARATQALHVGIDVMFEAGFTGHRVLEANAFGDLLPNLERDGLSVYEWEIRAVTRRAG